MNRFFVVSLMAAGLALPFPASTVRADAPPFDLVPAEMGPNALPVIGTTDPRVGDQIYVELAWLNHFSNYGDYSGAPYFKIVIPFFSVVQLEFDGTPLEVWSMSDRAHDDWQNPDRNGVSRGDIRFGVTATLVQERQYVPTIGVRFLVKTNTGKDFENRRFLDAPAYVIQALFGKDIYKGDGFLKKIRALAKLGFIAYQQGFARQNDAFDYGLAFQFLFDHGIRIDVDWRGYVGYQGGDTPSEIAIRLTIQGKYLDFFVGGAVGLGGGAPDWELIAGIGIHFPTPLPPWTDY